MFFTVKIILLILGLPYFVMPYLAYFFIAINHLYNSYDLFSNVLNMKETHNSYQSGEEDDILMSAHSSNKIVNNTFSDPNEFLQNIKLSNINRIAV